MDVSPEKINQIRSFDRWTDYSNYYVFNDPQRTPDWILVHNGRLSGSTIGSCVGHSNFSTPDEMVKYISGIDNKKFTPEQIERMNYGTEMEPIARKWYEENRGVDVVELGMAIPKFNPYLGVSVDGVVLMNKIPDIIKAEGIIEIKCVQRMYRPLISYLERGTTTPVLSYQSSDHIWKTHYDQMILGMKVLGKKWCDYIVFCPNEDKVFTQRIMFDPNYWDHILYPKTINFIDNKLRPLLKNTVFPIVPEKISKNNAF